MSFTDTSLLSDLRDHGNTLTGETPETCRICTEVVNSVLSEAPTITWGAFLAGLQEYPAHLAGAWMWIRINFDDVIEESAKIILTECAAQSEVVAGQLYIADPNLSQDEKDLLIDATANAPTVRREMGL